MNTAIARVGKQSAQQRTRTVWGSGDYSRIAFAGQIAADKLAHALDVRPTQRILDVAAGTGNFSLAAASRWADTTAIDIVPDMLKVAATRLDGQWLHAQLDIADAEELPYPCESFDTTASTFGLMYATNQRAAAAEITRVTRASGKIGLTNWTPNGFMGQMIRIITTFRPFIWERSMPTTWGTRTGLQSMFSETASYIDIQEKQVYLRYRSADHWLGLYHRYYGPLRETFSTLNNRGVTLLTKDLLNLVERFNHSDEGTMIVPCDYLQVVIQKH